MNIILGEQSGRVEQNAGELLRERILETGENTVVVTREGAAWEIHEGSLTILLGRPDRHQRIRELLARKRIESPNDFDPGPEGFLLFRSPDLDGGVVIGAGVDDRGVVYAVGEILRRMDCDDFGFDFPSTLDVRTAPAFEVRGTQFDQGGRMLELTGARRWSFEEQERVILDYMLAGANTFNVNVGLKPDDPLYHFFKDFALRTIVHYSANAGAGKPEWEARESIGRRGYLCPSISEARESLLRRCENTFKNSVSFDYVRFSAGDGGGCECDRCDPYGRTLMLLCEDYAEIIHRYHPETEIFVTNQKLDNDDDIAIFEYLNQEPRPWLRAICYGPGSDAMTWQQGRRQTHRMDLFRYPGFGPFDRYLREILHQLPPQQSIVFYNELTHWYYSQYGYVHKQPPPDRDGNSPPHWGYFIYERHPDPFLALVYERQTFFAWPRFYHYVFHETMRYGIGDVTHSSGHHDHFNQWMWMRLLWSPHTSMEDVVDEYAETWFGRNAAPLMAKAIFQLEQNLEEQLLTNDGIDDYYLWVKKAGWRMPRGLFRRSWLWRQYMQKAALDKYIQLDGRSQMRLQEKVEKRIAASMERGETDRAITEALTWFDERKETAEMRELREEAGRLGDESNKLFGVRNTGFFNLKHDFIGMGWLKKQLQKAQRAKGEKRARMLERIVRYEDPGEGGYYDNAGAPGGAPHMVVGTQFDHGQPYWRGALSESNRPSQRIMAFTAHESPGVVFEYDGLDAEAQYRVRFTFVRPRYQERYAMRMNQKSQSIYADDLPLAVNLELPEYESEFYEFDIPTRATKDGNLKIRFEKDPNVPEGDWIDAQIWRNCGGWGTMVSEIWLMKNPG
ncbi:MAG: hypothetical protein JXR73_13875 [Candidatus Omnitrophica bacterium]|nr:hypothetical protein [Candidatus Omnitrophota bacterium]